MNTKPKKFAVATHTPGDKLMQARCRLFINKPWYGVIAAIFRWRATKIKTMGVMIMSSGHIDAQYSPTWVDSLSVRECMGVVQHEIEHIIRGHSYRLGSRNPRVWNWATDMAINGKKSNTKIPHLPDKGCFLPESWNPRMSSEETYNRLQRTKIIVQMSDGSEEIMGDKDAGEAIIIEGEILGDHDIWNGTTASADEARQIVKNLCNRATQHAGRIPGNLAEALKRLEDPHISWRYELRNIMGRKCGGKRGTWSRSSRRNPKFGNKGKSNRARIPLLIAVDTSGSMDDKRLGLAFGALESASAKWRTTCAQFDHGYQCHNRYHRGDWKNIEIKGRGGTSFIKFFDTAEEMKLIGKLTIIITDGEAQWPEPKPYPVLWVIIPHRSKSEIVPPFGRTIYIEQGSK